MSRPACVTCPVCSGSPTDSFFSVRQVPVTCASIFATAHEASAVPRGDIELVVCQQCGCIFNAAFDPQLGETGARYESSQAASGHFSAFARSLAAEWVERYDLAKKIVIEVGCGDCDFLKLMLAAGVGTAIGIDPLASVSSGERGLQVIAEALNANHVVIPGDALVCRHTLEHIQNLGEFLLLLKAWADADPKRVLLFEVPDAERVLAERAFWDVYYEHCNYFTATTLRFVFEASGFEVVDLRRVYNDQYLVLAARSGRARAGLPAEDSVTDAISRCRRFGVDVRASIEHCQLQLARHARDTPPLVLWQGAAKTVGFLAALPDPSVVDSAIDLNPGRHGKFLPGSALPVFAPTELQTLRPGTLILMNEVYLEEVRTIIRTSGLQTPVYPVNALLRVGKS